jgi:pyruvate-ferredoxin/flavodoxin oxidoreductase
MLTEDDMRALINMDRVIEHRQRALSPDHPVLRGTAQNPDVFFQIREKRKSFYTTTARKSAGGHGQVRRSRRTQYKLFDYVGAPDAERVIVVMGSGAEVATKPSPTSMRAARKSAC